MVLVQTVGPLNLIIYQAGRQTYKLNCMEVKKFFQLICIGTLHNSERNEKRFGWRGTKSMQKINRIIKCVNLNPKERIGLK